MDDSVVVTYAAQPARWKLENACLEVRLARAGLELEVLDKLSGKTWRMEPEHKGVLVQKYGVQLAKPLSVLNLADWSEAREGEFRGVELRSVQPDPWQQYNVRLRVLLHISKSELRITVATHEDPGYNAETWLREVYYPRSFLHKNTSRCYTVLPFQQGTLLPGDWPKPLQEESAQRALRIWAWEAVTGPWWGHVDSSGAGYLAIIDTPDDVVFDFDHPAGGPTRVGPWWNTSFEAFRYPRTTLYRFYPKADHVCIALGYRDYCRRIGRWRSIEEKRLEKPQLDRLRGAIGMREMALITQLKPNGVTQRLKTFHEIARTLDQYAREHPDDNIYFILAGWQKMGYDHAHPDACPPNADAGGWEGMREVGRIAAEHGALYGVHDQYRDFYLSSSHFSEDLTRKDSRRDSPRHAYWAGGTQSILCPALMLDFVKQNVQQLRDQHVGLNCTYQDVLTAIALEECFDHRHPMSRTDCRRARHDVLDYYRSLGWLITTESASDWAAPALDSFRVHWPRLRPHENEGLLGIPVPLFSLVYHDCAILCSEGTPPLLAALSGVNTQRAEDVVLRRLHRKTAYMPLTGHELLSGDGRKQASVFGDSLRVEVDLDEGAYRLSGIADGELSGKLTHGCM